MNLLDENIPADQRLLLEKWRVRVREIGVDTGRVGIQDEDILPLLRTMRRPTFFTRDDDFYDRRLGHPGYAIVYLAVQRDEVAYFIRRLLRVPRFKTQTQRMGTVARVSSAGVMFWSLKHPEEARLIW